MATTAASLDDSDSLREPDTLPAILARAARSEMRITAPGWRELDRPDQIVQWNALTQWASEPNPYFESWFLLPALRALDPQGEVRLVCFHIDGQLAGLMPVHRSRSYYAYPIPHAASWVHPNCFLGAPLVARGCEAAFWRAALEWADRNCRSAMFLHLTEMPLNGELYDGLEEVIAEQNRPAGIVMRQERPVLCSALDSESYFETAYSPKRRRELRRQFNRLSDAGRVEFVWHWDDAGIAPWCEDFLRIEASGWKAEAGSALACSTETQAMFCQALTGAAQQGRLVRVSLTLDDRPIAMLANFVDAPGSFGFKTAFDESFAAYSPGVLLEREYLKTLDRDDIAWCDSCAAPNHPVISEMWTARRAIGRISVGIGGPVRRTAFKAILAQELGRQDARPERETPS